MRLNTLYLLGTLAVAAVPLSAAAQTAPANDQAPATVQQIKSAHHACPAGWIWEPAGYMGNGHWRSAHCTPRNVLPF
jgi:hypothetical protein